MNTNCLLAMDAPEGPEGFAKDHWGLMADLAVGVSGVSAGARAAELAAGRPLVAEQLRSIRARVATVEIGKLPRAASLDVVFVSFALVLMGQKRLSLDMLRQ